MTEFGGEVKNATAARRGGWHYHSTEVVVLNEGGTRPQSDEDEAE